MARPVPAPVITASAPRSNEGSVYRPAERRVPVKAAPKEEIIETDITYHAPKGCASGDCFNGPGILIRENQERYEGNFMNGKKNGFGVQFYPGGAVRYKGDFQEDLRSGQGTYYFTNGDKYVGYFFENVPQGKGTYHYADGERFSGTFRKGIREGYGVLTRANGTREAGYYKDDERVR